jgi:hypothetical protein
MAKRFKRIETLEEWRIPILNTKAFFKKYRKRKGRGMFPTTHDITPSTYLHCAITLTKLLRAGNEVLITTKPHATLIKMLCVRLQAYKEQVQFRFTITSMSDSLLIYWEENAPNYQNRKDALIHAFKEGFKTSVSIEPYLDANPNHLIKELAPYCTESIWLGIMNPAFYKHSLYDYENVKDTIETLIELPENILKKVRLKDSIKNMGFEIP